MHISSEDIDNDIYFKFDKIDKYYLYCNGLRYIKLNDDNNNNNINKHKNSDDIFNEIFNNIPKKNIYKIGNEANVRIYLKDFRFQGDNNK